jgi:uracil-DNA glycosylase
VSAEGTGALDHVLAELRACRLCADHLPLGPRPVIRASVTARLLIISQAPGTRVHETGLSFNDRSGDRLRDWLGVDRGTFYDTSRIAIMGMGFCYPGVDAKGGDLPPRPECAPLWHPLVLPLMPAIDLTLLVGSYALIRYLGRGAGMTETVADWRRHLPRYFPLPHPSWRNTGWLKRNPWFEAEALPELRRRVRRAIGAAAGPEAA